MKQAATLNRHQKALLRKLRENPMGLAAEQWPRAEVMRRWLAQEAFVAKLADLKAQLEMAAGFSTLRVSAIATVQLANALGDGRFDDAELLLRVLHRDVGATLSPRELASARQVLQRLDASTADPG